MTKIIFLDFDGVIRLPVLTGGSRVEAEYSAPHIRRVARLAGETGARVVISSDWRLRLDRAGIVDHLAPHLPPSLLHEDWATPSVLPERKEEKSATHLRETEIRTWLARHPGIEAFAILDDMHSKYFPEFPDHLVTCNLLDGFTETRLNQALEVLKRPI